LYLYQSMFKGKNLDSIEKSDLENLISDRTVEGQRIEYKSQMYVYDQKREMLKDISAMANAEGGYLILGISEDGDGYPQTLLGIENGEDEKDKILQSCHSSIEGRILGLRIKVVEIGSSKSVLVISIPGSSRKPHMVIFDKHNKFYIRHDRHNLLMSLSEIKETFLAVEGYMEKHVKFLAERKQEIKEDFGEKMVTVFYATPTIISSDILNCGDPEIRKLLLNPEPAIYGMDHWLGVPYPQHKTLLKVERSLYGLAVRKENLYGPSEKMDFNQNVWFDVYSIGHFEMKFYYPHAIDRNKQAYLPANFIYHLTQNLMTFVSLVKSVYSYSGININLSFGVNIYNCKNLPLGKRAVPKEWGDEISMIGLWRKSDLEIPSVIVDSIETCEPVKIAKLIMDKLYHAYGQEGSLDFDKSGNFIIKTSS
jgi:schlafen family protein